MWNVLRREFREIVWLALMIASLSLLSVALAVALAAADLGAAPRTASFPRRWDFSLPTCSSSAASWSCAGCNRN